MTNEWQVVVVIAALLGAVAAARFMRSDRLRVSIAISLIGLVTIILVLSFALRQRHDFRHAAAAPGC